MSARGRQNTSKPHCTSPCAEGKTNAQWPIHVYFWNDISIYVARSLPARQTFLRFFRGFLVFAIGWWGCAWKVNDMLPFKMTYDWRYIPLQVFFFFFWHMDKYSITRKNCCFIATEKCCFQSLKSGIGVTGDHCWDEGADGSAESLCWGPLGFSRTKTIKKSTWSWRFFPEGCSPCIHHFFFQGWWCRGLKDKALNSAQLRFHHRSDEVVLDFTGKIFGTLGFFLPTTSRIRFRTGNHSMAKQKCPIFSRRSRDFLVKLFWASAVVQKVSLKKNHPAGKKQFRWFWSIIATSQDLSPKCSWGREIPIFQGYLGGWNIIIWPEWLVVIEDDPRHVNPRIPRSH